LGYGRESQQGARSRIRDVWNKASHRTKTQVAEVIEGSGSILTHCYITSTSPKIFLST